jgi:hypothetical protein
VTGEVAETVLGDYGGDSKGKRGPSSSGSEARRRTAKVRSRQQRRKCYLSFFANDIYLYVLWRLTPPTVLSLCIAERAVPPRSRGGHTLGAALVLAAQ